MSKNFVETSRSHLLVDNTFAQTRHRRPALQTDFLRAQAIYILLLVASPATLSAAEVDKEKLPPPATVQIDFARDIQPILQESCLRCHGPEKPKSDFRLTNREAALAGGTQGRDILPGHSADSPFIHYIARLVPDMEMPPEDKGDPLTPEQISLLRAWVDQGVSWPAAEPPPREEFSVSPAIGWFFVRGDQKKFREHHWVKEGQFGGFEAYELKEVVDERTSFTVNGRALRNDYAVTLDVQRRDVGFLRAGFSKYFKYFDDSGGYHPAVIPPSFALDRNLTLELGKAWVEVGVTRPGWPRMVLGYDYDYREGDKSILQWLPEGIPPRNIRPASKRIDEETHLLRLDVNHEVKGFFLEDNVRYEFYDIDTSRLSVRPFPQNANPAQRVVINDGHDHGRFANVLRGEKQLRDWLFVSAGYLYTRLEGDASVELNTVNAAGAPITGGQSSADQIILRQWSHALNYNAQLGPWQGLTLTAGVQNEWAHQEGFGDLRLTNPPLFPPDTPLPDTLQVNTDQDRFLIEELFTLRYTTLPYTVLFAEARLRQESIGLFEEERSQIPGSQVTFLRDTDTQRDGKDFRAGFHISPWSRVSLNAHYRRRTSDNDYDHRRDERPIGQPGLGYAAFIRSQALDTDEVEAKLVVRPLNWLKTTFTYRLTATDFRTESAPASGGVPGRFLSGNYDANVFSANAVITPLERLYLSTTFSYTDQRSEAFATNSATVEPYRGKIFSVLTSITYALNPRTDFTTSYAFSRADFGQHNFNDGVPVGIEYKQHGLLAGLTRTLNRNFKINLQYAYYVYDEPSGGHFNDYTAHGIFATLAMHWR